MIGSCIYHNKNVALLDKHIISRVKVTLAAGYDRHLTDTATSVTVQRLVSDRHFIAKFLVRPIY